MRDSAQSRPSWDLLYETAAAQDGLFTTQQASDAGYSPQLLVHHVHTGRVVRLRRGVYRLAHFPAREHEELTELWLWSAQVGVFSYLTALSLHDLSDALPSKVHLTLPASWDRRRLRVPDGVLLHYADVAGEDRGWFGAVPVTTPRRTLVDCARGGVAPELILQATRQALRRGLVGRAELAELDELLAPFGGISS